MFSQHPAQNVVHIEFRPIFAKPLYDHDLLSSTNSSTGVRTATRAVWVDQCLHRLRELRPAEDPLFLSIMVNEIWHDVSGMHPVLAAEMEHECWD